MKRRKWALPPSGGLPDGPSRRSLLAGALLGGASLACAPLLGGCSPASAGGRTRIQLWHLFTGGDGGVFQSMMDAVGRQSPDIEIDPVVLTWGGPYYTKLAMSSVGGRSPDLAVMHATRVVGYAPGGLLDTWDTDRLADHGVTRDMFPDLLWDKCLVDGRLMAIPLDFHAFLLFYNTDLCGRAGLLDARGRLTGLGSPEAFLDAGALWPRSPAARACPTATPATGRRSAACSGACTPRRGPPARSPRGSRRRSTATPLSGSRSW